MLLIIASVCYLFDYFKWQVNGEVLMRSLVMKEILTLFWLSCKRAVVRFVAYVLRAEMHCNATAAKKRLVLCGAGQG